MSHDTKGSLAGDGVKPNSEEWTSRTTRTIAELELLVKGGRALTLLQQLKSELLPPSPVSTPQDDMMVALLNAVQTLFANPEAWPFLKHDPFSDARVVERCGECGAEVRAFWMSETTDSTVVTELHRKNFCVCSLKKAHGDHARIPLRYIKGNGEQTEDRGMLRAVGEDD